MEGKVVWQQGSSNPNNAAQLSAIGQWWASLNGKEVTWRQRLLPASGEVADLNWEAQRFDEVFQIAAPELRGITLYWKKPDSPQERNSTAAKLELDRLRQQLYIFPQSQKDLVLQVGLYEVPYQQISIKAPQWELSGAGEQKLLVIKDDAQKLEVTVALSAEHLSELKQRLG